MSASSVQCAGVVLQRGCRWVVCGALSSASWRPRWRTYSLPFSGWVLRWVVVRQSRSGCSRYLECQRVLDAYADWCGSVASVGGVDTFSTTYPSRLPKIKRCVWSVSRWTDNNVGNFSATLPLCWRYFSCQSLSHCPARCQQGKDFLVKIIDVNAAGLSSWVFAKVDGVVTLIILAVFATLALVKSHIKSSFDLADAGHCRCGNFQFRRFQLW